MEKLIFVLTMLWIVDASAWQVEKLQGQAQLINNGQPTPLTVGRKLVDGETIQTERKSKVLIAEGDSKIWIGQKSNFKVKPAVEGQAGWLELLHGKFRALVAPEQAKAYKYKLKSTVAGVRGTEFFAEANSKGDRICTLEGEVEATGANGESLRIPAGKGVSFRVGEASRLVANDRFLVDRWVAETSFVGPAASPQKYTENQLVKHPLGASWFYGLYLRQLNCNGHNLNLNSAVDRPSSYCSKTYISPFLQYGVKQKVFLRPTLNYAKFRVKTEYDKWPIVSGREEFAAAVGEAYYQGDYDGYRLTFGLQNLHWHDGLFISQGAWATEPMNHFGLRAEFELGDMNLEFLGTVGKGQTQPLDGISQTDFLGVNLEFAGRGGQAYVLYANLPTKDSLPMAYFLLYGREMINIGYYNKQKYSVLDYELSAIYQRHMRYPISSEVRKHGYYGDFSLGFNFSTSSPMRIAARYLYASRDFSGIHHDYYILGYSFIHAHVANLSQARIRWDWQYDSNWSFYSELLRTRQVSGQGIRSTVATSKENLLLGTELNGGATLQILDNLNVSANLWIYSSSRTQETERAHGWVLRTEYNY